MALDRTQLLSDVFSAMDINSDGRVDVGEFLRTTRSTDEAAELPLLLANMDDPSMKRGDGDGKLDLDEWVGGMSELFGSASDADFEGELTKMLGVLSSRSLETTTVPNLNFTASVRTAALDEEYNAEEPEAAEADAALGRREVADLGGATKLVELILNSELPPVLCGAAAALFNLALEPANVAALIELGALPRLIALLGHPDLEVQAAMAGVLMNCAGRSEAARADGGGGLPRDAPRDGGAHRGAGRRRRGRRQRAGERGARARARRPRQSAARCCDGGEAARVEPRGRGAARARRRGSGSG